MLNKKYLISEASRLFANWQRRKGYVADEVSQELSTFEATGSYCVFTITLRNANGVLAVYSYNAETERFGRRGLRLVRLLHD